MAETREQLNRRFEQALRNGRVYFRSCKDHPDAEVRVILRPAGGLELRCGDSSCQWVVAGPSLKDVGEAWNQIHRGF